MSEVLAQLEKIGGSFGAIFDNPQVVITNAKNMVAPSGTKAAIVGLLGYYQTPTFTPIQLNGQNINLTLTKHNEYSGASTIEIGLISSCKEGDVVTFQNNGQNWENHFAIWLT